MEALLSLIFFASIVVIIIGLVFRFSKKNREDLAKRKKGRNFAIIGIVVLVVSSLISSGIDSKKVAVKKVNGEILTYNQVHKKVLALNDELKEKQSKVSSLDSQISVLESKNKDVITAIKNKDELSQQVSNEKDTLSGVKDDISNAKNELKTINGQIDTAKSALSKAKGQVTAAMGAPKTLEAGKYTVGKDIKSGRYKATPVGSGSNFVVFGGGDETDVVVNTILGNGGEPSYTFECADSDVIQTEATVKLTPIK